jgi:HSP20 family molecular chaperone IbpA
MSNTFVANDKQESTSNGGVETTHQATFVPRFDIWEGEGELLLHGDLPGVKSEDLDIRFENRELSIRGKVAPRHSSEYLRSEYSLGDFHRSFTVGEAIDAEQITAEMKDGVLTLRLPKSKQVMPRRIQVTPA